MPYKNVQTTDLEVCQVCYSVVPYENETEHDSWHAQLNVSVHAAEYEQHAPELVVTVQTPREESAERTAHAAQAFLRSGQAPGSVQVDITAEMRDAVEEWEDER